MQNQIITNEQITRAFLKANAAYIARNKNPRIDAVSGMQKDLHTGLTAMLGFTEPQRKEAVALGVDFNAMIDGIGEAPNVKKSMRAVHFVRGLVSGDLSDFTGSARAALFAFAGIVLGARNRAGLTYLATGKGDEMSSYNLVTNNGRRLRTIMQGISAATFETQCSVAMGKGGILPILGICDPMTGKNAPTPADLHDVTITHSVYNFINNLTESQFTEWAESVARALQK